MDESFVMAHFSIAYPLTPVSDPAMNEFVSNIERVNQVAFDTPDFLWIFQQTNGLGDPVPGFDDEVVVINISLWKTPEALKRYVYSGLHGEFFKKRKNWFRKPEQPGYVLWWVDKDHRPDILEGKARLELLRNNGPTAAAFDFKLIFEPVAL